MNIRVTAETTRTITLAWDPVPGQQGFVTTLDGSETMTDGKRHFSGSPTISSVKIGKPQDGKPHSYGVKILGVAQSGQVTSPAPPQSSHNPICLNANGGQGVDAFSHVGEYGLVLTGGWDTPHAVTLSNRVLQYTSGADVWGTDDRNGVDGRKAMTNGWLLKNQAGGYLTNQGYPGNYIGDVGSAGYQQAFIADVTAKLAQTPGVYGIQIDDVLVTVGPLAGEFPAKYPDVPSWSAAMLSFVKTIGTAFRQNGYKVMVNANGWIPGGADSDNAKSTADWWRQLAPYVDYLACEYYMETMDGSNRLRTTGTNWYQFAAEWQQLVDVAQDAGAYPLCITYGPDDQHGIYGLASFLQRWDGKDGYYCYGPDSYGDPYQLMSRYFAVGAPVDPRGANPRRYTSGVAATVNLANATAQIS